MSNCSGDMYIDHTSQRSDFGKNSFSVEAELRYPRKGYPKKSYTVQRSQNFMRFSPPTVLILIWKVSSEVLTSHYCPGIIICFEGRMRKIMWGFFRGTKRGNWLISSNVGVQIGRELVRLIALIDLKMFLTIFTSAKSLKKFSSTTFR